jgi:hypothetical protein
MMNKVHMQSLPHLGRDNVLERVVISLAPVRLNEAETADNPVNMGVNCEGRSIKRVGEHAAGALRADSGE